MEKFKCKWCEKEFDTEKGLNIHIDRFCKKLKEEKPQEVIDFIIQDIVLEEKPKTIEDEMIEYFENVNLESIHLRGEKYSKFLDLWRRYYGSPLTKTCNAGICHSYSTMYYLTQSIRKARGL